MSQPKKVVVIGGGISGLSAAYYTQKYFKEKELPLELTVLEKGDCFGGKIQTLRKDEFVIERGPDSFLGRKLPGVELAQELGLDRQWVPTNPKSKATYIVHKGKLYTMPPGLMFGIPTQFGPFAKSGLISPLGKLRAGMDLFIKRRTDTSDESLGDFLKRRLGHEVVDNIAEPLLSGIYAGDAYKLSIKATFPQFPMVEKKYGSLIKGMIASKAKTQQASNLPEIAKKSMFISFENGLKAMIEALIDELEQTGTQLTLNTGVQSLVKTNEGYEICCDSRDTIQADAVICATPAFQTAKILAHFDQADALADIPYISVANVVMTFDKKDMNIDFNGHGFVVPRKEGRTITACTWTSSKWLHTAPEGKVLLRAYVGHAHNEGIVEESDEFILQKVLEDLKVLINLDTKPSFFEVNRWRHSMPQYRVGHVEKLKHIRAALNEQYPHVSICGAGYEGVGIPDCIKQGRDAAQRTVELFQ